MVFGSQERVAGFSVFLIFGTVFRFVTNSSLKSRSVEHTYLTLVDISIATLEASFADAKVIKVITNLIKLSMQALQYSAKTRAAFGIVLVKMLRLRDVCGYRETLSCTGVSYVRVRIKLA